jgi:leader peptidase (prepilin peptidase)/N-methyltransferase
VVAVIVLVICSVLPRIGLLSNLVFLPEPPILSGVIGGIIGFAFFMIVVLINPRGMGMGDVKLASLIGLITGFPLVLVALLLGITAGGGVGVVLLLLRKKRRKDIIPFGSFLAFGLMITLLYGQDILGWYLGMF